MPYNQDARKIKTARSIKAINKAVKQGFKILLKACDPSPPFEYTPSIYRHKDTGEYQFDLDPRDQSRDPVRFFNWEPVLDLEYDPPLFKEAFAAYLLPSDLEIGERVWIDDLIEDLEGPVSGQGLGCTRLESAYAVWQGDAFEIAYDPNSQWLIIG